MSKLLDLARADMRSVIESEKDAGTLYVLIDNGVEYPVVGTFGDIGSLTDPISGEVIQDRSIEATVIAKSIITAAGKVPARGWEVRATEPGGKELTLFVQKNEYDRTIGLCRLTLGLKLKETKDGQ